MKKRIVLIILFIILISLSLVFGISKFFKNDNNPQNLIPERFLINQIRCYSSAATSSNNENSQVLGWNLNLYQYTDIAIYLDRILSEEDLNYIKRLYIDNIRIDNPNKRKC